MKVIHFITIYTIVLSHWMKNTIVHISLCRSKILAVSKCEITPRKTACFWQTHCLDEHNVRHSLAQHRYKESKCIFFIFFHMQTESTIVEWNSVWILTLGALSIIILACRCALDTITRIDDFNWPGF